MDTTHLACTLVGSSTGAWLPVAREAHSAGCVLCLLVLQLAEEDAFDSEKDAASVAYNAAVKGAAKVRMGAQTVCACMQGSPRAQVRTHLQSSHLGYASPLPLLACMFAHLSAASLTSNCILIPFLHSNMLNLFKSIRCTGWQAVQQADQDGGSQDQG